MDTIPTKIKSKYMSFLRAYYKPKNARTRNTEHPRNDGTPPEHGTPAERRNKTGITEHHRNNGTPPEQWKQQGTGEQ